MIIEENNVTAKIEGITTYYRDTKILQVTLLLTSGLHTGTKILDKVSYHEGHRLNWKYHTLRNSAGLKFPTEFEVIKDVQTALVGKDVVIDLSEFKYTDYKGNPDSCQSVKYVLKCSQSNYNNPSKIRKV